MVHRGYFFVYIVLQHSPFTLKVDNTMFKIISKLAPLPLYPVGLTLLLGLIALILLVLNRRRITALCLLAGALSVLYLFSTPFVSQKLVYSLEKQYAPTDSLPTVSAILLCGGSGVGWTPPRQHPEINSAGDRIIHAARLYHQKKAPWIVTSGGRRTSFSTTPISEARHNATLLWESLGVDSMQILMEEQAFNTRDHAPLVKKILASKNLPTTIIAVTSAMHMPRTMAVLRKAGYTVYAAPADFEATHDYRFTLPDLFPSVSALERSSRATHEYYGSLAYKILGWI